MNKFYDELLKFKGAEELHALVAKWENLAANMNGRSMGAPIVLPDIILYTEHGFGNYELLSLLAEYLDSQHVLMDFSGDRKLLNFAMNYCPPDQPFNELRRLMNSVRVAAGYRNEFKGVVRIALDPWIGHHSEEYFFELMEYLAAHTSDWMLVLTLAAKPDERTRNLEATISMFLRTEVIRMHMPDAAYLAEYANDYVRQYGVSFDDSAMELLTASIEKLKGIKFYHSYNTVKMLCSDIVYSVMAEQDRPKTVLSAEDIKAFAADSDYIKKTELKSATRNALGFRTN